MDERDPELARENIDPAVAGEFGVISPDPGELEPINGNGEVVGLGVVGLEEIAKFRRRAKSEPSADIQFVSARDRLNRAPIRDSREEDRIRRREQRAADIAASRRRARARSSRPTDNPAQ